MEAADELKELKQLGWSDHCLEHLSATGLARCKAACLERKLKITAKNVEKIALDLDLRSIGEQALSDSSSKSQPHEVEGLLVLQIQKVKNVALPSTKQFSTHSTRRLLRIQLTDGQVSLAAVEMEGAIANISTQTPPGTKVLLLHKVEIERGFLLLGKNSLKVLGGNVEHLVQKWSLTKVLPDNLGRTTSGTDGAPQFTAFGTKRSTSTRGKDGLQSTQSKTREVGQRGLGGRSNAAVSSTRQAAVSAMEKRDEREKMELPKTEENFGHKPREFQRKEARSRGAGDSNFEQTTHRVEGGERELKYHKTDQRTERGVGQNREEGRGRGRGRGRGGRRGEREEEYVQGRKTETTMLSDWLEQKLTVSGTAAGGSDQTQPGESKGEDYWAEVWAYEESLAMAQSEEQWQREERERKEREKGRRGCGERGERGRREDGERRRREEGERGRREDGERGERGRREDGEWRKYDDERGERGRREDGERGERWRKYDDERGERRRREDGERGERWRKYDDERGERGRREDGERGERWRKYDDERGERRRREDGERGERWRKYDDGRGERGRKGEEGRRSEGERSDRRIHNEDVYDRRERGAHEIDRGCGLKSDDLADEVRPSGSGRARGRGVRRGRGTRHDEVDEIGSRVGCRVGRGARYDDDTHMVGRGRARGQRTRVTPPAAGRGRGRGREIQKEPIPDDHMKAVREQNSRMQASEATPQEKQSSRDEQSGEASSQYNWNWVQKGVPLGAKKQLQ